MSTTPCTTQTRLYEKKNLNKKKQRDAGKENNEKIIIDSIPVTAEKRLKKIGIPATRKE